MAEWTGRIDVERISAFDERFAGFVAKVVPECDGQLDAQALGGDRQRCFQGGLECILRPIGEDVQIRSSDADQAVARVALGHCLVQVQSFTQVFPCHCATSSRSLLPSELFCQSIVEPRWQYRSGYVPACMLLCA